MAFKDKWIPRVDGVDEINSSAVNEIAEEVINQEKKISNQQEQIEKIQKQIDNNGENEGFATETYVDKEIAKSETRANQIYANALKGTATGKTAVTVTDVSPISHDVHVELSGFAIPLYPYDTDTDFISGCSYTITDDGVYEIWGKSNGENRAVLIKTLTLPAGEYTFWADGVTTELGVRLVKGDSMFSTDIICHLMESGASSVSFTLEKSSVVTMFFTPSFNASKEYSFSIKLYLSKGKSIVQEGIDEPLAVYVQDENEADGTVYYADTYGFVTVKSASPQMKFGTYFPFNINVSYNADINSVIGDFDKALDNIITQQESIIEIQNTIIGGGNE